MHSTPIVIVGAGPAGCCLAALLADQGWAVTLLEAGSVQAAPAPAAGRTQRTLALAAPSWQLLARLQVTPDQLQAHPIRSIHVSYRGHAGRTCLQAAESGLDSFGHTVSYHHLLAALRDAVRARPGVQLLGECNVEDVTGAASAARVRWRDAQGHSHSTLAQLAVLAEGGRLAAARNSSLHWSYQQQALACVVRTTGGITDCAFERFTAEGPVALLPVPGGHAVIWTGPAARIDALLHCDDARFLASLQAWFGDRGGQFTAVGPRERYPLASRFSLQPAERRVVRVANAAQTLHPVAGQGFNLGLRDIDGLVKLLAPLAPLADPSNPGAVSAHGDAGRHSVLQAYAGQRAHDRWLTGGLTQLLAGVFVLPGSGLLATGTLTLFDLHRPLRRAFAGLMAAGTA